jgi:sialate O-acetylesterase
VLYIYAKQPFFNMTRFRSAPFFFLALFFNSSSFAQLRLPSVLGPGMVLQQKDSVTLWGWSAPGSIVYITTGWNNSVDSVMTTNGATWKLKVATPSAGGPFDITIASSDTIKLTDVMVGEVWICSGQSNMEWNFFAGEKDIRGELSNPANPMIRFFQVPKSTSAYPQDDVKARWVTCDSNSLKSITAVGYFFGKKISNTLNVPVGIINSSWGGTPAEVWTPSDLISNDAQLLAAAEKVNKTSQWWPWMQGVAYNAMIAPLTNFNIAGALWYQGESNVSTNDTYAKLLTTMIDAWRNKWNKQFPFYYVQIAPFNYGDSNINGALLQEAQTKAMSHPNVGMVVITDLVDSVSNIHPSHKREVGNRLANWALAQTYHRNGVVYRSPEFEKAEKKSGRVELSFTNVPTELKFSGKSAKGFLIKDATGQWYPAEGKINGNRVTVWNKKVKDPAEVRYAFTNTLIGNVSSAEGLPLTPFRTGQL